MQVVSDSVSQRMSMFENNRACFNEDSGAITSERPTVINRLSIIFDNFEII